jgi:predicted RNase H-like nuclease (RuvC/YqgF family)
MNCKLFLFLLLGLTAIVACGPSKSDRLIQEMQQRAHDDSVRKSAEEEMKKKLEMKAALTDSVSGIKDEISSMKEALGDLKAECEVQKDKLGKIKEFQFLRSRDEREAQIRDKVREIDDLENLILEIENKVVNRQVQLDYFISELQKYSDS